MNIVYCEGSYRVDEERIVAAVTAVWREARLEPLGCAAHNSLIVPLAALLEPFPIAVRERDGLTYGRAAEFLSQKKGHAVSMPGPDGQRLAGFLHFEPLYACLLTCRSTQVETKVDGKNRKVWRQEFITRRRFTIAHELAHYVLHFRPLLERIGDRLPVFVEGLRPADEGDEESALESDLRLSGRADDALGIDVLLLEAEADAFAAALLMPEATLRRAVEVVSQRLGARRENLTRRLSGEFLVSRSAMKRRLDALDLGDK